MFSAKRRQKGKYFIIMHKKLELIFEENRIYYYTFQLIPISKFLFCSMGIDISVQPTSNVKHVARPLTISPKVMHTPKEH